MTLESIGGAGGAWLIAALALGIAELVVPGVFLIFLAIAAAATGAATLVLTDLPTVGQLASFAVWSVVTVMIGRRWYRDYPQATSDALLNDRAGRLIGQAVIVETALVGGVGRVRVGDGSWPAKGPDMPVGACARIVAIVDAAAMVEPVGNAAPGASPIPDEPRSPR